MRQIIKFYISILFFIAPVSFIYADGVADFINHKSLQSGVAGICIVDIESGKTIVSHNEFKSIAPASVMKLLPTATTLKLYGPNHRFETKLCYTGKIVDGTLKGDLYVVGGGDPTLGSEYASGSSDTFIQECVDALKLKGIKHVDGRIVGDITLFDTEGVSPYWTWKNMGNYYAAGSYALNYIDNSYTLTFKSGNVGSTPQITGVEPEIPGLRFVNYLTSANNRTDSAYIQGAPFQDEQFIYGSIPANRSQFSIKGGIPNPPLFLVKHLTQLLIKNGITVGSAPITTRELDINNTPYSKQTTLLVSHCSEPLSEIVKIVNTISHNLYAETLLRHIALKKYPVGSAPKGIETLAAQLKKEKVNTQGLFMYDGSGLSPYNRVTARLLTDLLIKTAKNDSISSIFESSLPIAGKEGTLRYLLRGSALEGKLRLKSGSIDHVQCYAGYTTGKNKKAVVILVNNYSCSRNEINKMIEKLLLSILEIR